MGQCLRRLRLQWPEGSHGVPAHRAKTPVFHRHCESEAERSQAQRDCCREGRELVHEAPTAGTYNRTTYFDRYEGIADLDAWRRAP